MYVGHTYFLSATAPRCVPGAFAVLVTVPNADLLLDFLVQISAPITPFNIKLLPPVPVLLQHLPYGFAPVTSHAVWVSLLFFLPSGCGTDNLLFHISATCNRFHLPCYLHLVVYHGREHG